MFTLSAVCLHFRFLQKLYQWMLHYYSDSNQMTPSMLKDFPQLMYSSMKLTTLITQLLKLLPPFKTIMRENLQHKNPILLLEKKNTTQNFCKIVKYNLFFHTWNNLRSGRVFLKDLIKETKLKFFSIEAHFLMPKSGNFISIYVLKFLCMKL